MTVSMIMARSMVLARLFCLITNAFVGTSRKMCLRAQEFTTKTVLNSKEYGKRASF